MMQSILLALLLAAASAAAASQPFKDTAEASLVRGATVFNRYCVLCHGVQADGKGRAAKLYTPAPANLVTSDRNREYKELIIRKGGEALGRSKYMPPWGQELTDEQITDLTNYVESMAKVALGRGAAVFGTYCVLCHGAIGDGKGRAAKLYTPPPANLVTSDKNREYKELIIRKGGEALGRSKFMPTWSQELQDDQILDLVNYLESIAKRN